MQRPQKKSLTELRSSEHQNDAYVRLEAGLTKLRAADLAEVALSSELPTKGAVVVVPVSIFRQPKRHGSTRTLSFKLDFEGDVEIVFPEGETAISWSAKIYNSTISGVFYVGVGCTPRPATVSAKLDEGAYPQSISVPTKSKTELRISLRRLVNAREDGYKLLHQDCSALIKGALKNVEGAGAVGYHDVDLYQDAWVEMHRGLTLFAHPATRPSCTFAQWVRGNVGRTVQRQVDKISYLPSHDVGRVYRFATGHAEIDDPSELRERWAMEQGLKDAIGQERKRLAAVRVEIETERDAVAAKLAVATSAKRKATLNKQMKRLKNKLSKVPANPDATALLANLDLDRWVSAAPALSAFEGALKARHVGGPLSLEKETGSDEDGPSLLDRIEDTAEGTGDQLEEVRDLLAELFSTTGASDAVLDDILDAVLSTERVTQKRRKPLLIAVPGVRRGSWAAVRNSLMTETGEIRPPAVVRRTWRGYDAPVLGREAADYIRAGYVVWNSDLDSAMSASEWAKWACRIATSATRSDESLVGLSQRLRNIANRHLPEGYVEPVEAPARLGRKRLFEIITAASPETLKLLSDSVLWIDHVRKTNPSPNSTIAKEIVARLGTDLALCVAEAWLGKESLERHPLADEIGWEVNAALETPLTELVNDAPFDTSAATFTLKAGAARVNSSAFLDVASLLLGSTNGDQDDGLNASIALLNDLQSA